MALFSKHCSSHYHHHMLLALSSLISASEHPHLQRDSERKLKGGIPLESETHKMLESDRETCAASSTPKPITYLYGILMRAGH